MTDYNGFWSFSVEDAVAILAASFISWQVLAVLSVFFSYR